MVSHNRQFVYGPRGFNSIQEHDEAIIERWNSIVTPDDEVYILGDLMLNDNEHGIECLKRLNGYKHFICGNHDTNTRIDLYVDYGLEFDGYATVLDYKKYHFYLSHYRTDTGNFDNTTKTLRQHLFNLSGHTHQKTVFYEDMPLCYNVCLDAHNCYPVSLDQIIEDIKNKVNECLNML